MIRGPVGMMSSMAVNKGGVWSRCSIIVTPKACSARGPHPTPSGQQTVMWNNGVTHDVDTEWIRELAKSEIGKPAEGFTVQKRKRGKAGTCNPPPHIHTHTHTISSKSPRIAWDRDLKKQNISNHP